MLTFISWSGGGGSGMLTPCGLSFTNPTAVVTLVHRYPYQTAPASLDLCLLPSSRQRLISVGCLKIDTLSEQFCDELHCVPQLCTIINVLVFITSFRGWTIGTVCLNFTCTFLSLFYFSLIFLLFLSQCTRLTDIRTDGQTAFSWLYRPAFNAAR